MSTDFVCHGDARTKEIVRDCLLNTVIRGARAGASVIRFGALRRGSLGPLRAAVIGPATTAIRFVHAGVRRCGLRRTDGHAALRFSCSARSATTNLGTVLSHQ